MMRSSHRLAEPALVPISIATRSSWPVVHQADRDRGRYRLLDGSDHDSLADHYRSLSMADRIVRFHGAMSDDAVQAYSRGIDWRWHCAAAFTASGRIAAVAEVVAHPQKGWAVSEMALSLPPHCATVQVRSELVQIAILAARERGARALVVLHRGDAVANALSLSPDFSGHIAPTQDGVVIDLDAWFDAELR